MKPVSGKIVILTGAGISKESGLSTFRDEDGIWATVSIEDVATPDAFQRDPVRVHEFYNARRRRLVGDNIEPNAAHRALAQLERDWPDEVLVVTQNIDDLHERGGSRNVLHMHGEMLKARCAACGDVQAWTEDLSIDLVCDSCRVGGRMRPHVVWFGEMPFFMEAIERALSECGLFVSIGTSGNVYPAAGFVAVARRLGQAHTLELNMEPSQGATLFAETRYGPATEIVPQYVTGLLGGLPGDGA
jgi:NAD-dependent deacetylase